MTCLINVIPVVSAKCSDSYGNAGIGFDEYL
jgi:hypothetical protein